MNVAKVWQTWFMHFNEILKEINDICLLCWIPVSVSISGIHGLFESSRKPNIHENKKKLIDLFVKNKRLLRIH